MRGRRLEILNNAESFLNENTTVTDEELKQRSDLYFNNSEIFNTLSQIERLLYCNEFEEELSFANLNSEFKFDKKFHVTLNDVVKKKIT